MGFPHRGGAAFTFSCFSQGFGACRVRGRLGRPGGWEKEMEGLTTTVAEWRSIINGVSFMGAEGEGESCEGTVISFDLGHACG
jgi:hypothetical protein